ncbi:hypothetical protein [Pectobacterium cacticida]|uniref:hypothetical protein n=1 Tax=Pectobacterium cacticida TaxID=69221 RepID=UPI002FEFDD52
MSFHAIASQNVIILTIVLRIGRDKYIEPFVAMTKERINLVKKRAPLISSEHV